MKNIHIALILLLQLAIGAGANPLVYEGTEGPGKG